MHRSWRRSEKGQRIGCVAILATELDLGEAEAIVLAKERNAELLHLDEKIPCALRSEEGV
jgi:predicted nucleic acid-binding protein